MSLTDDWKAGNLEYCEFYYVKTNLTPPIRVDCFCYHHLEDGVVHCGFKEYDDVIIEVVAPCDYEELKELKQELRQTLIGYRNQTIAKEKAEEENKRLGKLARENFRAFEEKCDLYNKLQSITAKLDVAVKALENIYESSSDDAEYFIIIAKEALTAIRGDK